MGQYARGFRFISLLGSLTILTGLGCGGGSAQTQPPDNGTGGEGGAAGSGGEAGAANNAGSGGGSAGSGPATGLPCDVAQVLETRCTSCHSNPPVGGAPIALVTYQDLMAPSGAFPGQNQAQRALARMKNASAPMPPASLPQATAADVATFEAWVNAGTPTGSCGGPDPGDGGTAGAGGNPYDTPTVCTSAKHWTGGNEGSAQMHPGRACIQCHTQAEDDAPRFSLAGTVYPTAHEPNDCNGANGSDSASGASVEITDATQKTVRISINRVGNFMNYAAITPPYQAKLLYQGRERVMASPQTSGDCNGCHTESGANGAPGRIMLP